MTWEERLKECWFSLEVDKKFLQKETNKLCSMLNCIVKDRFKTVAEII